MTRRHARCELTSAHQLLDLPVEPLERTVNAVVGGSTPPQHDLIR
jgi:hypothetical protein